MSEQLAPAPGASIRRVHLPVARAHRRALRAGSHAARIVGDGTRRRQGTA